MRTRPWIWRFADACPAASKSAAYEYLRFPLLLCPRSRVKRRPIPRRALNVQGPRGGIRDEGENALSRRLDVDRSFDLDQILDGTQDFRWRPRKDDWHSGVLDGKLVHLRQVDGGVEYRAHSDLDTLLHSYFRLDDDVSAIHADLSARDEKMARLVRKYPHLRVLRQPDPWECMVAYICSATNNVNRIGAIVEKVAETLGHEVELDGELRHTFPTPDEVLQVGLEPLEELGLGMDRHSKIVAAADRIRDGRLDLCRLSQPDVCYAEAKRRLMACYGIGDKVADCISLFALDKMEAFPVDRWVERAMAFYFPDQERLWGDDLVMWAQDYFGNYAGYANQLLFHEQRKSDEARKRRL